MTTAEPLRVAVVGASEGLGRGIAEALAEGGARVLAVARRAEALAALRRPGIETHAGDATDPTCVDEVLDRAPLDAVVLVAGARPAMGPISTYSWQDLKAPFDVDVHATLLWLQGALKRAPTPSRIVVFSSGAALHGSPLSGGYAGAKQTQRFLCGYAAKEAAAREIPLRVQCVLPQLNPNTALGRAGVEAYARSAGMSAEEFVKARFGDAPLDPRRAGDALVELLTTDAHGEAAELLLTGAGLRALGASG